MKYFIPVPQTAEELKKLYRKLAMRHHPDRGGSTAVMQAVNAEYTQLWQRLQNVHQTAAGETYHKETQETPDEFIDIINKIIWLEGVTIEIIGSFVWVTGSTYQHKETLKDAGFRWSKNKSAWFYAPDGYRKQTKKVFEMDEIRGMFGSQVVAKQVQAAIG